MRDIEAATVTATVSDLFRQANYQLGDDVIVALRRALGEEESPAGRNVISKILENAAIAAAGDVPLCQDCGAAVVFLELGQEAHISGGDLYEAVELGVKQSYEEGCLRKSMVGQPFSLRRNTGDNTPAIIHCDIVPGDKLRISAMPKGGGAENMSRLAMLTPSQGREGIVRFVVDTVAAAGSNPCPPVVVGVGIGGTSDKAMLLAKRALLRPLGQPNRDGETAGLEEEILQQVNNLGIGPMGYGGRVTALAVHIETFPAHIASLPVAVNLQCHSARHREAEL